MSLHPVLPPPISSLSIQWTVATPFPCHTSAESSCHNRGVLNISISETVTRNSKRNPAKCSSPLMRDRNLYMDKAPFSGSRHERMILTQKINGSKLSSTFCSLSPFMIAVVIPNLTFSEKLRGSWHSESIVSSWQLQGLASKNLMGGALGFQIHKDETSQSHKWSSSWEVNL